MGNYRFKLLDLIPNSWFHKLKDMGKTTIGRSAGSHIRKSVKKSQSPSSSSSSAIKKPPESQQPVKPGRASYYIPSGGGGGEDKFSDFPVNVRPSDTKILTDPPRKSKKKPRGGGGRSGIATSTCKAVKSSVCICHTPEHVSAWMAEYPSPLLPPSPPPPSLIPYDDDDSTESLRFYDDKLVISCKNCKFTPADIIIDTDNKFNHENPQIDFTLLPPIRTKKKQPNPNQKPDQRSPRRRTSAGIQRLRRRANSPIISTKKTTAIVRGGWRKGISGSFAVVKSSVDPHKDFRESMVEMIAANNIRTAKDLEELLTCYLSLNSDEYHDVIVKVFEKIWFELTNGRKL